VQGGRAIRFCSIDIGSLLEERMDTGAVAGLGCFHER
jgi:hypothetical protein